MAGQTTHHPGGYEKRDANVRWITIVAIVMIVLIIFFAVALNELFIVTKEEMIQKEVLEPQSPELLKLRSWEDSVLSTYELIDTVNSYYRIPVDSAMSLLYGKATTR